MQSGNRGSRPSGFTIIELIIVIAIIGILATLALPNLRNLPRKASEAALKTNLHTMRDVIDQHLGDKGYYPPSLQALVDEGYLRAIPVDPFTDSAETWVPVFEEIDPEAPPAETDFSEEGLPGVIDVRSGSTALSLDGEAYSQW